MNKENTEKKVQADVVELEITFEGSEDIPIAFANHIFIRHMEDVFLVTFAQSHGPYIVNPTAEQLKQMHTIPAKVVARIAVPPTKMKEIIDVLNENYSRFVKTKQGKV